MLIVGKRRLTKATFGVILEASTAVSVPAGQVVEILTTPIHGERTIDVIWDGKKVMMFVSDLGDRSQPFNP
jgi:hypothetical protein